MRAIFLDRDGVINENRPDHVKSWNEFVFLPGVLTALRLLRQTTFHLFIVTNQAIIQRGLVSTHTINEIHARMAHHIAWQGGHINEIRYCPHDSHAQCECRKPRPGMLLDLAKRWQIDLDQSYLIGDAWTDIAAGRAANCRCVLVRTGRGGQQTHLPEARLYQADHTAADLLGAVEWLLHQEGLASLHHATQCNRYPMITPPHDLAIRTNR